MAKSRGNGNGGLYPERKGGKETGRYIVQIVTGHTPKGYRYKRQIVTTKGEGEKLLRRLIAEVEAGKHAHGTSPTLAKYAQQWLERIDREKAPKTGRAYRLVLERHVLPMLGKKRLDAIRRRDIRVAVDLLHDRPSTAIHVVRVLSALFKTAMDDDHCSANPASQFGVPEPKRNRKVLTEDEVRRLMQNGLDGSPIRELTIFILHTGTRIGEATGVVWANEHGDRELDLDTPAVMISGQLQRVKGNLVRRVTKTGEPRIIPFPKGVANLLREMKARHLIEGYRDPEGIVFLNNMGRRVDQSWFNKHLRRACEKAGTKVVSAHELRHTYATIGLAKTGNLHAVQKALGHKQVSLTADLYGHVTFEGSKQVSDALGAAFGDPDATA